MPPLPFLFGNHKFVFYVLFLFSCSVVLCDPHGLLPARLLCPWDFPGKNTGVGCHFLLQGIFPTKGLNLNHLHWQVGSLPLSHKVWGSIFKWYFSLPISHTMFLPSSCLIASLFLGILEKGSDFFLCVHGSSISQVSRRFPVLSNNFLTEK